MRVSLIMRFLGGGCDAVPELGRSQGDDSAGPVDAKAQLSSLVEEAAAGAEIIIAKAGKPRAKLMPLRQAGRRKPGSARGRVWMADDFDAPLPTPLAEAFGCWSPRH